MFSLVGLGGGDVTHRFAHFAYIPVLDGTFQPELRLSRYNAEFFRNRLLVHRFSQEMEQKRLHDRISISELLQICCSLDNVSRSRVRPVFLCNVLNFWRGAMYCPICNFENGAVWHST